MNLGEKIKYLRKSQNMSQETLANHLKINRNYLSRIERFQKDLEKDRWIIEQYYKEQRKKYADSLKIDSIKNEETLY